MNATTPSGTAGTPVLPGVSYTFAAWFKAATTGRGIIVYIDWYTAAGSGAGQVFFVGANDSTTVWTRYEVSGVAPATAAYALLRVYVSSAAAGEVHYVDSMILARTADLTWLAGGRAAGAVVIVERSLDNGVTWAAVRGGAAAVWPSIADQQLTLWDYEVARGVPVLYRARIVATIGTLVAASPNTQAAAAQHAATGWWLKDPLAPGRNMVLEVQPGFRFRPKEPQSVFEPLGVAHSVVITDGPKGIEGQLQAWTKTRARYEKLQALVAGARPLWLEDVFGRAWYIKLGESTDWSLLRAQPDVGETTPIRHLHEVSLPFVEVGSPTGETVLAGTPTG